MPLHPVDRLGGRDEIEVAVAVDVSGRHVVRLVDRIRNRALLEEPRAAVELEVLDPLIVQQRIRIAVPVDVVQ